MIAVSIVAWLEYISQISERFSAIPSIQMTQLGNQSGSLALVFQHLEIGDGTEKKVKQSANIVV